MKSEAMSSDSAIELGSGDLQEILASGLELRQYSQQVATRLREAENGSICDYIQESGNIIELHGQLANYDQILSRMETILQTFQQDLGSISQEILEHQQQSVRMNQQLKNQQAVHGQLSQFVDDITVPETIVRHIVETSVTEPDFLENLMVLDHKLGFVRKQSALSVFSCQDVGPVLDKLKIRAISKIRDFLLEKVLQFRKPMSNFHLPQNVLLKFKFFFTFLLAHQPEIAREVRDEYTETMGKVYFSYFKTYWTRLMRLQHQDGPSKDDLLATEESTSRSLFSTSRSSQRKGRSTVFSIGSRGDVLAELEKSAIVPHVEQQTDTRYTLEVLFRSVQYVLLDNACREYLFLSEFFAVPGASDGGRASQDLFNSVLGRTLQMLSRALESLVADCHDSIALFLCMHQVHRFQLLCHKRAVPALDRYWDAALDLLRPRFEHIVEQNVASLRQCDPSRLSSLDVRPGFITRRYAEYSAALVAVNEQFPSERVHRLLMRLRIEMENLTLRLAAEFQQRGDQLVFLINNYELMLSVLLERTHQSSKESETFGELLARRVLEYVDAVLAPHFGGLIQFVKDAEAAHERGGGLEALAGDRLVGVVRSFNKNWRQALQDINNQVMRSFTNFRNGSNILQDALKQLIIYYDRFQKVLVLPQLRTHPARAELVNIHTVMVEVKKFKPNF